MDLKDLDLSLDIATLSEEQLESVTGGRITEGDRKRLADFVKQSKYLGASFDECIDYIRGTMTPYARELYLDDYIAYITEIW